MYPRGRSNTDKSMALSSHFGKGDAEFKTTTPHLKAWTDADLSRDILSRRSTTNTVHTWGGVAFAAHSVLNNQI